MSIDQTETGEPTSALQRIAKDPVSRRKFLAFSGGGIGAGALFAACGGDEEETTTEAESTTSTTSTTEEMESQFGEGDIGILNFALTLEYLEADFYDQIAKSGLFEGEQAETLKEIGKNEQAHVKQIRTTVTEILGGEAAPKVKGKFDLKNAKQVLELATTIENVGASAYLGQAPFIMSQDVLQAGLAIHTVEARHAAYLARLSGAPITPNGAFAKPRTMEEVLKEVEPFIKS